MAIDIAFFLARDDETAAETRPNGPGPALTSLTCHYFDPDDAVVEWEMYFKGLSKGDWPRYVAPVLNDGIGVFAVSDELTDALANAAPSTLRELASRWAERLRLTGGDDMAEGDAVAVLRGVAQLAATAAGHGSGLRLYCWHY
ncbi:hypothetical protein J7F01_04780 [Streptomyces sp. ISL-22]|uniref:hypothetical protein n=1 Tax=unclassified Streptomyces TaxID=2593676 RepID=UPI001BE72239|nr:MULTISPECIES: hypothetical protein [unclassified Streptomyces]MBT2418180.1 hypothetical protein [Streptomyces sp. ISL-24]MBT2431528.1 hypothetical protein [Streptomyces sp. ISL-22]